MKELATKQNNQLTAFNPQSMTELMQLAEMLKDSAFVPTGMQGKPQDILPCIMYGNSLGMHPMQSLQNIAVINGRPSLYGDGMLAVVMGSTVFESIKETFDDSTMTATCTASRKDGTTNTQTFSQADAEQAGLWARQSKAGSKMPWSSYPKRMLKFRARGFCLRDTFPDILNGIISTEEAGDYPEQSQEIKQVEVLTVEERAAACTTRAEVMAIYKDLTVEEKTEYKAGLIALANELEPPTE